MIAPRIARMTRRALGLGAVLVATPAAVPVTAQGLLWPEPGLGPVRVLPAFGPFVALDTLQGVASRIDRDGGRYRSVVGLSAWRDGGRWAAFADLRAGQPPSCRGAVLWRSPGFSRAISSRCGSLWRRAAPTSPATSPWASWRPS